MWLRPSVGDSGTGGTKDLGTKASGWSWLIGNRVGTLPVARAKAQATAAAEHATPASPAPPGWSAESTMTDVEAGGTFHWRV